MKKALGLLAVLFISFSPLHSFADSAKPIGRDMNPDDWSDTTMVDVSTAIKNMQADTVKPTTAAPARLAPQAQAAPARTAVTQSAPAVRPQVARVAPPAPPAVRQTRFAAAPPTMKIGISHCTTTDKRGYTVIYDILVAREGDDCRNSQPVAGSARRMPRVTGFTPKPVAYGGGATIWFDFTVRPRYGWHRPVRMAPMYWGAPRRAGWRCHRGFRC